jgi:hypothetical protein
MAQYLLYHRFGKPGSNASGRNAVIASGATLSDAIEAAIAACVDGATRIPHVNDEGTFSLKPSWAYVELDGTNEPIFVQGNAVEPLQRSKGR